MRRRLATGLGIATLALAAPAVPADNYRVAAGTGVGTGADVVVARFTLARSLASSRASSNARRWRLRGEAGLAAWQDERTAPSGRLVYSGSLRAVLAVSVPGVQGLFAEVGTGVMQLSDRRILRRLDLGSHTVFDSHLGLGFGFGTPRRWELTYSFHHASNGSLAAVNPGMEFHLLQLGRRL